MKAKVWTLVISYRYGDDLTVHGSKEDADRALYAYVGAWWRREMGDEEEQTGNDEQDARDYFEKTDESANIEEHEIDLAPVLKTMEYPDRMSALLALEEINGLVPCVVLSAEDILEEAREDMQDEHFAVCEPGDKEAAAHLTPELALDLCHEVAAGDWSDTNSEASWRVKCRLMEAAREAAKQTKAA